LQELINLRTRNSKHFDLGDGQRKAVVTFHDQHYKQGEEWLDIDLTILPCNLFEFEYYCNKNNFTAYFNDSTDAVNFDLASFEVVNSRGEPRWINYKLVNATPERIEIEQNKIKYINAYPGIDVEYIITERKLKENVFVRDLASYKDIEFSLKMDGCTYSKDFDGNIIFTDIETNELLYMIKAPYAFDPTYEENPDYVFGYADYRLGQVEINGNVYDSVKVVVDSQWLQSAVYPITIDPTTVLQPDGTIGQDIRVDSQSPLANYSSDSYTTNSIGLRSASENRLYAKFDLSGIFGTLSSATLELYCSAENNSTDVILNAQSVDAEWTYTTIIWNNKPTTGQNFIGSNVPITGLGWKSFDITSIASEWVSGAINNYGVALCAQNITDYYDIFISSNNSDSSLRPKLTIDYTESGAGTGLDLTCLTSDFSTNTIPSTLTIPTQSIDLSLATLTPTLSSMSNQTSIVVGTGLHLNTITLTLNVTTQTVSLSIGVNLTTLPSTLSCSTEPVTLLVGTGLYLVGLSPPNISMITPMSSLDIISNIDLIGMTSNLNISAKTSSVDINSGLVLNSLILNVETKSNPTNISISENLNLSTLVVSESIFAHNSTLSIIKNLELNTVATDLNLTAKSSIIEISGDLTLIGRTPVLDIISLPTNSIVARNLLIEGLVSSLSLNTIFSNVNIYRDLNLITDTVSLISDTLASSLSVDLINISRPINFNLNTNIAEIFIFDPTKVFFGKIDLLGEMITDLYLMSELDMEVSLDGDINMTKINQNFNMYAGESKNIIFTVTLPQDKTTLDGTTIIWKLYTSTHEYLMKDNLDLGGITIDNNICTVKLLSNDTLNLNGKYYHRLEIIDIDNNLSVVSTGVCTFSKV